MRDEKFSLAEGMHLHLVGIGGSGMSSIARVLLERGYTVSGSDQQENKQTVALRKEGAEVFIDHKAENIAGAHGRCHVVGHPVRQSGAGRCAGQWRTGAQAR